MNTVQCVEVFRVSCSSPGDLRGVQALIDQGSLQASQIVAVMGKTEGNGCDNDHTHDAYESMGFSRGASALHSTHASVSAGIELEHNVVIVLGEAAGAASPIRIGHTAMRAPPPARYWHRSSGKPHCTCRAVPNTKVLQEVAPWPHSCASNPQEL
jgi:hypothetical protein